MNVTRDVMNDLLPLYFSGEASADTRTLVEEYFRDNPDFERMARGSAKPLNALRAATAVAPEAEKEKRDLQSVHRHMWRKRILFGMAVFFTLAPLAFVYSKGHISWIMVRNDPGRGLLLGICRGHVGRLFHARASPDVCPRRGELFDGLFPARRFASRFWRRPAPFREGASGSGVGDDGLWGYRGAVLGPVLCKNTASCGSALVCDFSHIDASSVPLLSPVRRRPEHFRHGRAGDHLVCFRSYVGAISPSAAEGAGRRGFGLRVFVTASRRRNSEKHKAHK